MIKIFGIEAREIYSESIGLTEWRVNFGPYCGLIHLWKIPPSNMGKYHWHLTPPYPGKLIDGHSNNIDECIDMIQRSMMTNYISRRDSINKMVDNFTTNNKVIEEYVQNIRTDKC